MFRLSIIFVILLLAAPNTKSQWADWERLPGPTGGLINSFAEVGGDIVAAPNGGAFYRSTDGGASWEFLYEAAWTRNTSVLHGAADGMLYALGYSGSYRSSDRGQSWTKCSPGDMALFVATASDGTVLFGMRGAIAVSTDQGASWTQTVPLQGAARDYKVAVDLAGNWYAGAYQTGVFRSTDRGASWESIESGLPNNVVYSVSVPAGDAVYVGLNNATYRSSDTGNTWEEVGDLFGMNTFSVQHAGGNILIATTTQGNWISTDFGLNWSHGSFATYPSSVFVFARRNGTVLYSTAGRVLRSTDRGASFGISDEGLSVQGINHILVTVNGTILASNEGGGMYRSTDNGTRWEYAAIGRWGVTVGNTLETANGDLFALLDGVILRSSDDGATWTDASSGFGAEIPVALCHDADTVFAALTDGSLYSMAASPASPWQRRGTIQPASAAISTVFDLETRQGTILAATDVGLGRSVDGGATWQLILIDGLPKTVFDITPIRPVTYAAAGGRLYRSTDTGATWSEMWDSPAQPRLLAFNAHEDLYLLEGDSIRIMTHWEQFPGRKWMSFPATPYGGVSALAFHPLPQWQHGDGGKLFAGTTSRGLFRSTMTTLSAPASTSTPGTFDITSLYPLPVSPGTETLHLGLDLSRGGAVTIEIRDLLGRVLRREEQGTLTAGSHALSLRVAELPSSMLLLQVHGPGGTRTRLLPVLSVSR